MRSPGEGVRPRAPLDDGFFASVRGVDQWITLRGAGPPLLILSGPGVAFSRMAPFFAPWETDFTLVQWDQPGAGATYARNGELALSLDRLALDAAAVAEVALARLGARKLVVLGVSGGSIVGLKLANARPDLVAAYVGTGQIVHWGRQAAAGYAMALAAARGRGEGDAVAALERVGPPPYAGLEQDIAVSIHANTMTAAQQAEFAGVDLAAAPGVRSLPAGLDLPDPRVRGLAAYAALRAEIAAFDAWTLGTRFEVPMVFLQGEHDTYTPTAEVAAYAAALRAPAVRLEIVPGGGHSAVFLRAAMLERLREVVGALE
jgi:pimeloyl-ACP methyl ester carboxylesterase